MSNNNRQFQQQQTPYSGYYGNRNNPNNQPQTNP